MAASSPLRFTMFIACVLVLIVVAAAGYDSGMPNNMAGMQMGPAPAPAPSASPRSLSYSAGIIIFLPLMLTFLVAKQRI